MRGVSPLSPPPCFLSLCIWLASTKPIPRISFSEEDANFSKVDLVLNLWMWAFVQKFLSFLALEGANLTKEDLSWNLIYFSVQKYLKFKIFQTHLSRKQQFVGLFCRLGNLGGAVHKCPPHPRTPPPPHNGHAFNMYAFGDTMLYMYVEWTLNNLFTQIWQLHQNATSQTWICVQQGWVCGCCPFSTLCKTSPLFFH